MLADVGPAEGRGGVGRAVVPPGESPGDGGPPDTRGRGGGEGGLTQTATRWTGCPERRPGSPRSGEREGRGGGVVLEVR